MDTQTNYGHRVPQLAIGFGVTVAMWAIAYVSMMNPGLVIGEILFAIMLLCLAVGGYMAGRWTNGGWRCGLVVGLVSATLNLMLIGSLVGGRDTPREVLVAAAQWGLGAYLASAVLATIGAFIGAARRRALGADDGPRNWLFGFTCVAAAAVFLLLSSGGIVTGLEAGLAVPDWPNSFGHNMLLYPLSEMVEGKYYEHAHRLNGMLVGVTTITLTILLFVSDPRGWMKTLGVVLLVMVCIQGVMGGFRVTEISVGLAVLHGIFGQVFFATMVMAAAFTSTRWVNGPPPEPSDVAAKARRLTAMLLGLLLLQLTLGALYRHLSAEPDVSMGLKHGILGLHVLVAAAVTAHVVLIGLRGCARHAGTFLKPLGAAMIVLVCLQLALGVGALALVMVRGDAPDVPVVEVAFTSAHQSTGALLLAGAGLTAAWTRRLLA